MKKYENSNKQLNERQIQLFATWNQLVVSFTVRLMFLRLNHRRPAYKFLCKYLMWINNLSRTGRVSEAYLFKLSYTFSKEVKKAIKVYEKENTDFLNVPFEVQVRIFTNCIKDRNFLGDIAQITPNFIQNYLKNRAILSKKELRLYDDLSEEFWGLITDSTPYYQDPNPDLYPIEDDFLNLGFLLISRIVEIYQKNNWFSTKMRLPTLWSISRNFDFFSLVFSVDAEKIEKFYGNYINFHSYSYSYKESFFRASLLSRALSDGISYLSFETIEELYCSQPNKKI